MLAVGTTRFNFAVALAMAALNFTDPDARTMILVMAPAGLLLQMFVAGEPWKRAEAPLG
ncbi:hypothetical protein [Methanoculleus caldifontis]|uniref:hypothetical protein n=1 Tax=Methanoculleus caldifontis TaxID=2651577 RepID=UPI0029373BAA|nr:hypothetical protein [Methanoculleus sp. Wushi-C6]